MAYSSDHYWGEDYTIGSCTSTSILGTRVLFLPEFWRPKAPILIVNMGIPT